MTSKVVAVLVSFARPGRPLSLADVQRATGLPSATALRLLRELVAGGLLDRDGDGMYRVGMLLWEIGSWASHRSTLRETALPFLEDLYVATGQNVQLAVLDGTEALVIEKIHGRESVTMDSIVGARLPLHATGVGKALLAHAAPDVIAELVDSGLRRYTKNTIVEAGRLGQAMRRIRDEGVAYNFEERQPGLMSVAAAVRDGHDEVVAALSVSMRTSTAATRRLAPVVVAAARGVGRALSPPRKESEAAGLPAPPTR